VEQFRSCIYKQSTKIYLKQSSNSQDR